MLYRSYAIRQCFSAVLFIERRSSDPSKTPSSVADVRRYFSASATGADIVEGVQIFLFNEQHTDFQASSQSSALEPLNEDKIDVSDRVLQSFVLQYPSFE